MERKADCRFCYPASTNHSHFGRFGLSRLDMVPLLETDYVKVLPDILPVSQEGIHFLMVPKIHRYSYAAFPEFSSHVGFVLHEVGAMAGEEMAFFEHGGVKDNGKSQSVYHAHAHMISTQGKDVLRYMSDALTNEGIQYQWIETPDESPIANLQQVFQNAGYLYVQRGRMGIIAHDYNDSFPSQLTQRNMSKLYSGRELNWKETYKDDELAVLSCKRIFNIIERCKR